MGTLGVFRRLLLLECAPVLRQGLGCGAGEEGRSEDGTQAPSGDLSLDVDVGAAGGPGESIWPLVIEAPSLTRGTGCLEDSAEWGLVEWKEQNVCQRGRLTWNSHWLSQAPSAMSPSPHCCADPTVGCLPCQGLPLLSLVSRLPAPQPCLRPFLASCITLMSAHPNTSFLRTKFLPENRHLCPSWKNWRQ